MSPVTIEHRSKDAQGHDVVLGRTVSYDRIRVASRVLGATNHTTTEEARIIA